MDAEAHVMEHQGFWETLKERIGLPQWLTSLNISAHFVVQLCIFFVGGFLVGFLARRYIRSIIFICIVITITLIILHYFHIISIHSDKLKELFGMSSTDTFEELFSLGLAWMRTHIMFSIGALLGFIIGFRIG